MKISLVTATALSSLAKADAAANRVYRHHYKHPSCSRTGVGLCRREGGTSVNLDHGTSSTSSILDGITTDIFRSLLPLSSSLYHDENQHENHRSRSYTPRYDITENDEKMVLSLDLPGVHSTNISIELREDGSKINISGFRKFKNKKQQHGDIEEKMVTSSSTFDQTFTIDNTLIDVDTIEANLSEGVLIVSAQKWPKTAVPSETTRQIPIQTITSSAGDASLSDVYDEKSSTKEEDIPNGSTKGAAVINADDIEISEEEDVYSL